MLHHAHPALLLTVASVLLFTGCSGGSKANPRSGAVTLSATSSEPTAGPVVIHLGSAQLEIDSAQFHVGDLEIEMHKTRAGRPHRGDGGGTMHGVENEGGGEHGNENEGENQGSEGEGNESETIVDELRLAGPYTFDLATGSTVIESVPVVPGTFDRVDLRFVVTAAEPFTGASIVASGVFVTNSSRVPFTLRSDFDGGTHVPIANGGITITVDSVVPVELAFNLTAMFGSLDFAHATVTGGEILIDSTHNEALLLAFETTLHGCVGGRERHHDR